MLATETEVFRRLRFKPLLSFNNRVSVWRGDITQLRVDVIVNSAKQSLLGGAGGNSFKKSLGFYLFTQT